MYAPHRPKASLRSAGAATRASKAGMAMTTTRKPVPSTKRDASSQLSPGAAAPSAPAAATSHSPPSAARRSPTTAASAPVIEPAMTPSRLNRPSTQPAVTSPMPRSRRSAGRAGGTLPIWHAATMPAATSRQTRGQSVRGSSAVMAA